MTARDAALGLGRVMSGNAEPGFGTPAGLWGPDFGVRRPGVTREDLDTA